MCGAAFSAKFIRDYWFLTGYALDPSVSGVASASVDRSVKFCQNYCVNGSDITYLHVNSNFFKGL